MQYELLRSIKNWRNFFAKLTSVRDNVFSFKRLWVNCYNFEFWRLKTARITETTIIFFAHLPVTLPANLFVNNFVHQIRTFLVLRMLQPDPCFVIRVNNPVSSVCFLNQQLQVGTNGKVPIYCLSVSFSSLESQKISFPIVSTSHFSLCDQIMSSKSAPNRWFFSIARQSRW